MPHFDLYNKAHESALHVLIECFYLPLAVIRRWNLKIKSWLHVTELDSLGKRETILVMHFANPFALTPMPGQDFIFNLLATGR